MADIIILKNSPALGRVPKTSDLQFGEPAVNTLSGQLFFRTTDKVVDEIVTIGNDKLFTQKVEVPTSTHHINLDITNRQVKELKLNVHTALQFINPPAPGNLATVTLFIFNNGDNAIKWVNKIMWENGRAPSLANNAWTIIELMVYDGGEKYFGSVKASNLKEVI